MAPPLPIGWTRQIAGFVVAVGDHDVAEGAEQRQIRGVLALLLPGGAVAAVSALTPASGMRVTMLPFRRAASAARPASIGANQSGGYGCCNGRASMRRFLHR